MLELADIHFLEEYRAGRTVGESVLQDTVSDIERQVIKAEVGRLAIYSKGTADELYTQGLWSGVGGDNLLDYFSTIEDISNARRQQ